MLERLKNWLKERFPAGDPTSRSSSRRAAPQPKVPARPPRKKIPRPSPDFVEVDPSLHGKIESQGPGKNVLIRNPYRREDTGTHETLQILDEDLIDTGEDAGIDPYNTGGFDRSRKWDQRFRK